MIIITKHGMNNIILVNVRLYEVSHGHYDTVQQSFA